MKWTPLNFGKYEGKTLPQVMFEDADWFFDGHEKGYFKNRLPLEAIEIYRRAHSIRVLNETGKGCSSNTSSTNPMASLARCSLFPMGPS